LPAITSSSRKSFFIFKEKPMHSAAAVIFRLYPLLDILYLVPGGPCEVGHDQGISLRCQVGSCIFAIKSVHKGLNGIAVCGQYFTDNIERGPRKVLKMRKKTILMRMEMMQPLMMKIALWLRVARRAGLAQSAQNYFIVEETLNLM
jgi:hypothetical protein